MSYEIKFANQGSATAYRKLIESFEERSEGARRTAIKAGKQGNRVKAKKFHSVKRVWRMAAQALDDLTLPF